ncbi:MAG: protease HtpX [Duodenibacillus sp.]|nr:protease HtpX [Duodenibacillus sp.]
MKRIGLFILTNIAVVVMLGIVLNVVSMVTGVNFGQMAGSDLDVTALLLFALVVGFTGSIISLLMSKQMAKMSMGVQLINTNNPAPGLESWLVDVVRELSEKAGVKMPEVGIYDGEPNAFATGASKNASLVCVSTGLLRMMNKNEVKAVLGHEMSHVANGDMVTLTLIQGVMNTFVIFVSRLVGWVVDRQILRNEDDGPGAGYYITSLVMDLVFGVLAGMVVAWFSRYREYRADEGSARLLGNPQHMIEALQRLGTMEPAELPASVKGLGISGGIGSLMASHPPIEDRIAALRTLR